MFVEVTKALRTPHLFDVFHIAPTSFGMFVTLAVLCIGS